MADIKGLDRIDLADIHQPRSLARRIHGLLGPMTGPVPAVQIAKSLDISEVCQARFDGFEGMLLTDRRRSDGKILANTAHGDRRARFTVAHELGHFLMERHVPSDETGFRCSVGDMKESRQADQHFRQEAEANCFAIELLAPPDRFEGCLNSVPDLEHVRQLAKGLDLSKEATARRYVELHDALIAIVFFQGGTVRYFDKSDDFPFLMTKKDSLLPASVEEGLPAGTLTDVAQADPKEWLEGPTKGELWIQTLYQDDGYGISMLTLDTDDPDDGSPEDAYHRYTR